MTVVIDMADETETLRRRVAELERENASLQQRIETQRVVIDVKTDELARLHELIAMDEPEPQPSHEELMGRKGMP